MKKKRSISYTLVALGVYAGSFLFPFFIPLGLIGFISGWDAFYKSLTGRPTSGDGAWLLGLSWLANPAVCAAMLLLARGHRRWALVSGQIAVMLALCAVRGGWSFLPYYLWVASMVLVVYAAIRVPATTGDRLVFLDEEPGCPVSARPDLGLAVGLTLIDGVLVTGMLLGGDSTRIWTSDLDRNDPITHSGDEVKARIVRRYTHPADEDKGVEFLPATARNFWEYEGGNFGGDISYWKFDCDSAEDCIKAVEYIGNLQAEELQPWTPSRYSVVMEGPDFYHKAAFLPWDVRSIKNGLVYEHVTPNHERMEYFAIDLDRNRVYFHYESGGFSADAYRSKDAGRRPGRLSGVSQGGGEKADQP